MKCAGKDRELRQCRVNMKNGEKFCKLHLYMEEYTEEMMNHLTVCSTCKKAKYLSDSKICDSCKTRSKKNRKNVVKLPKCAVDNCKSQRSVENQYCGKHQLHQLVDEVSSRNKRLCVNYIRSCRTEMELNDPYKKCHECRTAESAKDRERRKAVQDLPPDHLTCTTCRKTYDDASVFEHVGLGTTTKTCAACREQCRIQNERRDKEHVRELARKNEAKESRKEQKRGWANANWDKVASRWLRYRQRRMNADYAGYLQKNAAMAKQWRERNPDKVKSMKLYIHQRCESQYTLYKYSSQVRSIEFALSYADFEGIVNDKCHYCYTEDETRGFHGVDRIDSSKGYFIDNCVACCKICNYMKGSLHKDVFLKRVEHILTHNGLVEGELFPECFADIKYVSYTSYLKSSVRRGKLFEISKDAFSNITAEPCYLCGKQNTQTHTNGVDRYDNKIGYILENCRSSCGSCNYMKGVLQYDTMFSYLQNIYEWHKHDELRKCSYTQIEVRDIQSNKFVKKTKEQLVIKQKERKNICQSNQLEKYNDTEWLNVHCAYLKQKKSGK